MPVPVGREAGAQPPRRNVITRQGIEFLQKNGRIPQLHLERVRQLVGRKRDAAMGRRGGPGGQPPAVGTPDDEEDGFG